MSIRSQLHPMMIQAMKARDQVRLDTIRFILSQAKTAEIDLKHEMSDDEMLKMLKTEVKNRSEAIEQFRGAGRQELVDEEEAKLKVIQEFMPAEMSDADLEAIVGKVVAAHPGENFGLVMKAVMAEVKGQADGKRVTEAVKKASA